MSMTQVVRIGAAVIGLFAGASSAAAGQDQPRPYMRVADDAPDGNSVRLEMAVRTFQPADARGPVVYLAAAVHIAESEFYRDLQAFLDAQDVVLYESVKPPGAGSPAHDVLGAMSDGQRRTLTERRVRFIGNAATRFRAKEGRYPATIDEIGASGMGRMADLLRASRVDAWGHPIVYSLTPEENGVPPFIQVTSFGADGAAGGDGIDADLRLTDQPPLTKSELGDRSKGIQQKLADALGVEFQLNAMHHDRPNWRNSDLSVDQVEARLAAAGADADMLFSMLDGSSFGSKVAGLLIGMLGSTPESRAMLRVAMIEMIGHADALLEAAPGGLGAAMDVIIIDRNTAVLDDLRRILADEPGVKSIAIIYGGGHLPDLERRLVKDFGYAPAGDQWRTAMRVDAKAAGISPAQLAATRKMISGMVRAQTKRGKK